MEESALLSLLGPRFHGAEKDKTYAIAAEATQFWPWRLEEKMNIRLDEESCHNDVRLVEKLEKDMRSQNASETTGHPF